MPDASVLFKRLLARLRMRHLQAIVKLADLGHVQRAAQAMGMTQPALSQLLADLERLTEAPLFFRHAKGVMPTPLTEELLPLARLILTRLEESAELISCQVADQKRLVRTVATVAGANGLLTRLLPKFAQEHPEIEVLVSAVDNMSLSAAALSGDAEIIFCRQPAIIPQGWQFTKCQDDRFVIACGLQHPLATRKRLVLKDLAQERWLPNTIGSAARERHEQLLQRQGWPIAASSIVTRISTLTWTLLDTQNVLTLVPYSVVSPWVERKLIQVLPVVLDMPFEPIGMLLPVRGQSMGSKILAGYVQRLTGQDHATAA
jgi:DNA-binding transcriptional LysR family regulator